MLGNQLKQWCDERKGGEDCLYNGYLEDFLHQEVEKNQDSIAFFESILEDYPEAKVCVQLRLSISKDVISNQIIGYRDAFKLPEKTLVIPYLILLQHQAQERLLVLVEPQESGYLYAKALYLCLTEQGAPFETTKNQLLALEAKKENIEIIQDCFQMSMGSLQRRMDQNAFTDFEELYQKVLHEANLLSTTVYDRLDQVDDKGVVINDVIAKWFLLKKVVYVQYMIDRKLAEFHQGDVKERRKEARSRSRRVPFVVFSELWRFSKDKNETEVKTQ